MKSQNIDIRKGLDFEERVKDLFKEYGFKSTRNLIFKEKGRKHQIDVFASCEKYGIAIECKYHNYLNQQKLIEIFNNLKIKIKSLGFNKPVYLLIVTKNNNLILNDKIIAIKYEDLVYFLNNLDIEINKLVKV
ncbi:MAG: restriction endonuclease [Candidatus Rehaiarchaeum fermentans]|nr:restriction endonuclease [Candidatus Rehaiarchaeum fermentans]